jgi:hypothetical protein
VHLFGRAGDQGQWTALTRFFPVDFRKSALLYKANLREFVAVFCNPASRRIRNFCEDKTSDLPGLQILFLLLALIFIIDGAGYVAPSYPGALII